MLLYEEFKTAVIEAVQSRTGADIEVTPRYIKKNNGVCYDGIDIRKKGAMVSPTVYLNGLYESYENGEDIGKLAGMLIEMAAGAAEEIAFSASDFRDYEKVRDHIIYELVGRESNEELLKQVPYVPFLDLAIVFLYLVDNGEKGVSTVLIHNNHKKLWGATTDDLYEAAKQNTPKLMPFCLRGLNEFMGEALKESGGIFEETEEKFGIHVLTNRATRLGASVILYPQMLQDFADVEKSDVVIIPSSIHETLLVPLRGKEAESEMPKMDEMVRCVNQTSVPKEEILSNHSYLYRRSEGRITMLPYQNVA